MATPDNGECSLGLLKFFERSRGLTDRESTMKGLGYQPRPSDVLLTTGPKCGTVWVQHILHGLRSGGNIDFDEVDIVIPFVELYYSYDKDGDLDASQPFEPPRFFRMHTRYEQTPGFNKRIVLTRDPKDAIVSAYFFFKNWLMDEEVSLDEFAEWMLVKEGVTLSPLANAAHLKHLISWFPHRGDDNVLWLHFEDLKEDLTGCIHLIAQFLDLGANDPELLKLVEQQASLEFMRKHHTKFDSHHVKIAKNEALGLPRDCGFSNNKGRVRNGQTKEGVKFLSKETNEKIDAKWKATVEPVVGYGSYEEMRAAINAELGRHFDGEI